MLESIAMALTLLASSEMQTHQQVPPWLHTTALTLRRECHIVLSWKQSIHAALIFFLHERNDKHFVTKNDARRLTTGSSCPHPVLSNLPRLHLNSKCRSLGLYLKCRQTLGPITLRWWTYCGGHNSGRTQTLHCYRCTAIKSMKYTYGTCGLWNRLVRAFASAHSIAREAWTTCIPTCTVSI